jgi:hypothetical protein
VSPRPLGPLAVWLALAGQLAGAFGLPAVRGSGRPAQTPDAACGCCPADRAAQRCCCSHKAAPVESVAPCCRGKKAADASVVWVHPSLRAKCLGPDDATSSPVAPAGVPPAPPAGWSVPPGDGQFVTPVHITFPSRSVPPDDPPPRGR